MNHHYQGSCLLVEAMAQVQHSGAKIIKHIAIAICTSIVYIATVCVIMYRCYMDASKVS